MKNINKNVKRITALTFTVFLLLGCNEMLTLDPLDRISDSTYWKSADEFKLAVNQLYSFLGSFDPRIFSGYHADANSDLATPSSARSAISNGTNIAEVSASTYYTTYYSYIRQVNIILDKASAYATPSEIAVLMGEARFFRAYFYFELLQYYGAVPLILKPLSTDSEELYQAKNTRDEVVDQIVIDLEGAIAVLPLESAISASEKGRISKGAAQSFLARVALYEGTWNKFRNNTGRANDLLNKAITNASSVIQSAEYELFAPAALGDSAYKYMFILEDEKSNPAGITKSANKEYVLANKYSTSLRQTRLNITRASFDNVIQPTRKLASLYLCSDGLPVEKSIVFQGYATAKAEYQNRDNRMWNTLCIPGKAYWDNNSYRITWLGDAEDLAHARTKSFKTASGTGYHHQKWASERQVTDYQEGYDYPVIRYAEVLLIYAEAVFERNEAISDADLDMSLNLVRQRVNKLMPKLSNTLVSTYNLDMRTEIRRERSVELFSEGFRLDDLKRWKTAETELGKSLKGIKWTGTEYQTSLWKANTMSKDPSDSTIIIEDASVRHFSSKNYLFPFPLREVQLNTSLAQNDGW